MTWIRTVSMPERGGALRLAMEKHRGLYPVEYDAPVHPTEAGGAQIVESHSLVAEASNSVADSLSVGRER
jgi:hypothetical protein